LEPFGFRVGFACLMRGQFAEMRESIDSPLYETAMRHRFDLTPAWRLARIIREENYELIHSHTARSALVAGLASLMTGVPMVHHVHSPTGCDTTHRVRNWINSATERLTLRRAAAIIAVSESLGRLVRQQGFAAERVFVVPNGVPCRPAVPPRTPEKTSWTLGAIALFRPRKGLETLLRALAILRAEGRPVRLRAVGRFETPEYESTIRSLAVELRLNDAVDWPGFARDVDAELAQMDLFVLPSLFGEGLPMVMLEAMSSGLPVVASSVEGVPEAVRDDREGLLVEPGNPDDLARAVRRFIAGEIDWSAARACAIGRHAELFSDTRMAAGVAEVYRKVIK
jgi:glycosyltransferase involved in cell wall biosynthesis